MGKRTYLADTIAMALLYRKEYVGTQMIEYDNALAFDEVINQNLDMMNFNFNIKLENSWDEESDLFVKMQDENGKLYVAIKPDADLEEAWKIHVGCLPAKILLAAQSPNALETIHLEFVDGTLKDKQNGELTKGIKFRKSF